MSSEPEQRSALTKNRHTASYWVISAKQAETRARRFATLVDDCSAGQPIKPLRFTEKR